MQYEFFTPVQIRVTQLDVTTSQPFQTFGSPIRGLQGIQKFVLGIGPQDIPVFGDFFIGNDAPMGNFISSADFAEARQGKVSTYRSDVNRGDTGGGSNYLIINNLRHILVKKNKKERARKRFYALHHIR